jgi:hypothetical protein
MLFTNHKIWTAIFLIGSLLLAIINRPIQGYNLAYIAGWVFGMAFMCAVVAGLAFLVSFIVRRKLNLDQLASVFFGTFLVIAALNVFAALVR